LKCPKRTIEIGGFTVGAAYYLVTLTSQTARYRVENAPVASMALRLGFALTAGTQLPIAASDDSSGFFVSDDFANQPHFFRVHVASLPQGELIVEF